MTLLTGHSKLFNYPSSLLPQAPEPASKLMGLEADPELEKVCLCHGLKPLGIINKMHVCPWLERIPSPQLSAVTFADPCYEQSVAGFTAKGTPQTRDPHVNKSTLDKCAQLQRKSDKPA